MNALRALKIFSRERCNLGHTIIVINTLMLYVFVVMSEIINRINDFMHL